MDINTIPDRLTTSCLLLIAIISTIANFIPQIQSTLESIPVEYRMPVLILALIIVAVVGVWSFYTSEKRSENAYNKGLNTPVPGTESTESQSNEVSTNPSENASSEVSTEATPKESEPEVVDGNEE